MKETSLADVNDMEDGMPIPQLFGHVASVFDRKSGTGEFGEWSFQDAVLTDGNVDVKLKFKNMEDMKSLQGKEVTIRANKSKTHGLTGVIKMVEDYKGKFYHKVQLTNSCKIVVGLPNGERESAEHLLHPTDDDFIPMTFDDKGKSLAGVDEARHHIQRAVNLYVLCVDAVDAVIKPHVEGMTAEMYQAAVSSLFIESSRSGFIAKMPADKPLKQQIL